MTLLPSLFGRSRRSRLPVPRSIEDLIETFAQDWPLYEGDVLNLIKVDVKENDSEYIVKADLPGVEKNQVNVTLNNQLLTISVEQEEEKEDKDADYLVRERRYQSSQRSIPLALAGSTDNVKAEFKNGVLEIRVKKAPEKQNKKIAIQ